MYTSKYKGGFTLVELIISMAIMSMLFVSTVVVISTIYSSVVRQNKNTEMKREVLFLYSFMQAALHAGTLSLPASDTASSHMVVTMQTERGQNIIDIYNKNGDMVMKRNNGPDISLGLSYLPFTNVYFKKNYIPNLLSLTSVSVVYTLNTTTQEFDILTI